MANIAQYVVQIGDDLLGAGVGDEASWNTDSVHETEASANSAAAARRAKRAPDSVLRYRVVRIEPTAPYAQTVTEAAS